MSNNVIDINKNAPDTRDIRILTDAEVQVRARTSIDQLKIAMSQDDVAGALAALRGFAEQIDIESYMGVKLILQQGMPSCGRVCYNPRRGWYDANDADTDAPIGG